MAINIKDEATSRVIRELAQVTGESITTATRTAVTERLARLQRERPAPSRGAELLDIVRRARLRDQLLDDRSDDEILGYGPDGLPA